MSFQGLPDGSKFKALEAAAASFLPSKTRAVVRFDGNSFSRYTKSFEAPYDERFMSFMDAAAVKACELISGSHFAYVQSDEISVVFSDISEENPNREMWFNGKIGKILSVGAATVSAYFAHLAGYDGSGQLPVFDARVHPLASVSDVEEYVRWRRFDAQKNSVNMAAGTLFSSAELHGKSSKQRLAMLEGTSYARLPEGFYNGRIIHRVAHRVKVFSPAGVADSVRHKWVSVPATRAFMENEFVELNC